MAESTTGRSEYTDMHAAVTMHVHCLPIDWRKDHVLDVTQ